MKNNKKGFTIIELLAVIVILAIIGVILTPIIIDVIDDAKVSANERSAENYLKAVEITLSTQRLKKQPVADGMYYIMEGGNICIGTVSDSKCSGDIVKVAVNGEKPVKGVIIIKNDTVIENGYEIKFGDNVIKPADSPILANGMCLLEEGTAMTIGAKYKCNVGKDVSKSFYILEIGDTTKLTKGDRSQNYQGSNTGTTAKGEVSLILEENIDDTLRQWCSDVDNNNCNAKSAFAVLDYYRKTSWKDERILDITLPTVDQIKTVNSTGKPEQTPWLYGDLDSDTSTAIPTGYWTSTAVENSNKVKYVQASGCCYSVRGSITNYLAIRPVITVSAK